MEILHGYTRDGLNLEGIHFEGDKDLCVLLIHGMAGSIIDNYFGEVLGYELSKIGYGMVFGHNRGWGHISDFVTKEGKLIRVGSAYEIFEDSVIDIDFWINKVKELGYKKVILMGHSIGANKVIYYMKEKDNDYIKSIILGSISDIVGGFIKRHDNYQELLEYARVSEDKDKLLPFKEKDWYVMSCKTFLNIRTIESSANNFSMNDNLNKKEQLSYINKPILMLYGSKENNPSCSIEWLEPFKDIDSITTKIIEDTGHTYRNKELILSKIIIEWINNI